MNPVQPPSDRQACWPLRAGVKCLLALVAGWLLLAGVATSAQQQPWPVLEVVEGERASAAVRALLGSGWGVPSSAVPGWLSVPYALGSGRLDEDGWAPLERGRYVSAEALGHTVLAMLALADSPALVEPARARSLATVAGEALAWSETHLLDPTSGLYRTRWPPADPESSPEPADQIAMLWAWSSWIQFVEAHPEWAAESSLDSAQRRADALFRALRGAPAFAPLVRPAGVYPAELSALNAQDQGRLLQALSWYAPAAGSAARRTVAQQWLRAQALKLLGEMDHRGRVRLQSVLLRGRRTSALAAQAAAIQGLLAAAPLSGDPFAWRFERNARGAFDELQPLWDDEAGMFIADESEVSFVYGIGTVGEVVGAFAALRQQADERFADRLALQLDRYLQALRTDLPPLATAWLQRKVEYDPQRGLRFSQPAFNTADAMYAAFALLRLGRAHPAGGHEPPPPPWSTDQTVGQLAEFHEGLRYLLSQTARQDRSLGNAAVQIQTTKQRAAAAEEAAGGLQRELNALQVQVRWLTGGLLAALALAVAVGVWRLLRRNERPPQRY